MCAYRQFWRYLCRICSWQNGAPHRQLNHCHQYERYPGKNSENIKNLIIECKLQDAVTIYGPAHRNNIPEIAKNYTHFIQLSEREGLAISVIEAMQLGLVPVVTPVGEIPNYCKHMFNSFIVNDLEEGLDELTCSLKNELSLKLMRKNAFKTWKFKESYNTLFDNAIQEIRDYIRPNKHIDLD